MRGGGEGHNPGMQQGPFQILSPLRSLEDFSPEHLTWSQLEQDVHCTDVGFKALLQMLHFHVGPGFCSIPARISKSRMRLAGSFSFFV